MRIARTPVVIVLMLTLLLGTVPAGADAERDRSGRERPGAAQDIVNSRRARDGDITRNQLAPKSTEYVDSTPIPGCALSQFPYDPSDTSLVIGAVPYHDVAPRLCDAAASDRVTVEVGGHSSEGRELPIVTLTAPWTDAEAAANEALETLILEDPAEAATKVAAGEYDGYRPHITINSNIHGDEYEGLRATLEIIEYLASADLDAPYIEDTEGLTPDEVTALPTVGDVLNTYIITVMPTANPDGRVNGERRTSQGIDPNRDHSTLANPENVAITSMIIDTMPTLFIDIHGYVHWGAGNPLGAGLIEPCTPPHNPAYEYDLYLPTALMNAENMERHAYRYQVVRDVTGEDHTYIPYRDDEQGWDDWPPIYTGMFAAYHGGSGHTVEIPTSPRPLSLSRAERAQAVASNTAFARGAIEGVIETGMERRDILVDNQIEWFRRGVAGEASHNGDLQDDNFPGYGEEDVWTVEYPDAYVIPVGDDQESVTAAARLVDHLLYNNIEVYELTEATTLAGVEYPAGSWVVPMKQSMRSLAQSLLSVGVDLTTMGIRTMYDISGWSHSDLWGATVVEIDDDTFALSGDEVVDSPTVGVFPTEDVAGYSLTIKDANDITTVFAAIEMGIDVSRTEDGTIIFPATDEAKALLEAAANEHNVVVTAVTQLPAHRVSLNGLRIGTDAVLDDLFVLDSVWGAEIVTLDVDHPITEEALADIDVVVLTGSAEFNAPQRDVLTQWVTDGGAFVGFGGAHINLNTELPTTHSTHWATNGTVTVTQQTDSVVMPNRDAEDVTFVYQPTSYTDLPEGWTAEQVVVPNADGGAIRAGHWAYPTTYPQSDFVGEALTVAGSIGEGRVVLSGTQPLFRNHAKGTFKDLFDWMMWATSSTSIDRVYGESRVETSVAVAEAQYPEGAPSQKVYLARSDKATEGATGLPLAVAENAPILLTTNDELHPAVVEALGRLLPDGGEVVLLGGEAALSVDLETEIADLGLTSSRIAGPARAETAVLIANKVMDIYEAAGTGDAAPVYVVEGRDFIPATIGGAVAANQSGVVLVSDQGAAVSATTDWIAAHTSNSVTTIGAEAHAAYPSLGTVAETATTASAISTEVASELYADPTAVGVSTNASFPDPLVGASHVAKTGPLLLTDPTSLSTEVSEYLTTMAFTPDQITIYGGPNAVAEDVETAIGAVFNID